MVVVNPKPKQNDKWKFFSLIDQVMAVHESPRHKLNRLMKGKNGEPYNNINSPSILKKVDSHTRKQI